MTKHFCTASFFGIKKYSSLSGEILLKTLCGTRLLKESICNISGMTWGMNLKLYEGVEEQVDLNILLRGGDK